MGLLRVAAVTLATALLLVASPVMAEDYYNAKWFDFPDGATKSVDGGCAQWINVLGTDQCAVPNAPHIEAERVDVKVIVSGPDSPDQAIRNALVGYAAGCVATALAASTAGPQVLAAPAGFYGTFHACIAAISVSGIAGAILNQFDVRLDTSETHWAPI